MTMEQAPGCYGSALTYEEGAPECASCPFAQNCAPLSAASLARIHEKYGIKPKAPAKRPAPAAPVVPVSKSIFTDRLPAKVVSLIETLERRGVRITESLRQGRNPFTEKPVAFRIACHLLLRSREGVDVPMLTQALQLKLNYTKAAADSNARVALQVLEAVGATVDVGGKIMIRRSEG
jgi:hypothetical protein